MDLLWGSSKCPGLRAIGPARREPEAAAQPTAHSGASRQVSLLTCEPVVFSFTFGFCFPVRPSSPHLPPTPCTLGAVEPCHQQTREQRESLPLPGSAEMTHKWKPKDPFGGDFERRGHVVGWAERTGHWGRLLVLPRACFVKWRRERCSKGPERYDRSSAALQPALLSRYWPSALPVARWHPGPPWPSHEQ